MEIGNTITVTIEGNTRDFTIIAIDEDSKPAYTCYILMNAGGAHWLYLRKGFVLPQEALDIKDHIICYDDEIRGHDYYFKIHVPSVLPL